jgi:tetratricopeptide (TPR) repeat protein
MRGHAPFVAYRAPRIGAESVDRVFLIENHDQAYYIWRDAGVKNRTLVHIDAHHDMHWADEKTTVTIANFICSALREALLGEIFWVVPDATFQNEKSRKAVSERLKRIMKKYPKSSKNGIVEDRHQIATLIMEKKLTICTLLSIPILREAVLLDIDVDYLVIPAVSHIGERDKHGLLPWLWPNDLIKRLHHTGIRSDLVTVAYSVEGGYTPVQWKYLGQEVMLRLKDPLGAAPDMAGMCRIRRGAEAEQRGESVIAESYYRQAQELLPKSAAAPYRLARLLVSLGRIQEAKQLYKQAVLLDGSYRSAYSSSGFYYYWRGELTAAEREFQDLLTLDPSDAYCQLGLGLLAVRRKRYSEAEQRLRTALKVDNYLLDAQRALGDTLAKLGRTKEAILAYQQALKLGVSGDKALKGPILTDGRIGSMDWVTLARLGGLYAEEGDTVKALGALRMSIAGGLNRMTSRLQLARLYWKQGQWRDFTREVWQVINMALKGMWASGRRNLQRALHLVDEL